MIEQVIEHFGGVTKTARALGVTSQAVSQWRAAGMVPEMRAYQIELKTKGKFKAERLATH